MSAWDDEDDRNLAKHVVRLARGGCLADTGHSKHRGLDLGGMDVLAAPDDQVLDAPADRQEAILVLTRQVAGAIPALGGQRGNPGPPGAVGAVVANHHARAAHPY